MMRGRHSIDTGDHITADEPYVITVTGTAVIPKKAERAVLNILVASSGEVKSRVTSEVTTTARQLRDSFEKYSTTESGSAEPAIAHWNMTSLSTTSRLPRDQYHQEMPHATRIYDVNISFNVRVRDFSSLGTIAQQVANMPHTRLANIEWVLTADTREAHNSELRNKATTNALQQAKEYSEPLGITKLRPIRCEPRGPIAALTGSDHGMMQQQAQYFGRGAGMAMTNMVAPPDPASFGGGASEPRSLEEQGQEYNDLTFLPEEVRMTASVEVTFIGES
ncbi:hypothetical protein MBLNU457_6808t1 [Dothideomycetes sp. NU457]